jgi:hypothetical protein
MVDWDVYIWMPELPMHLLFVILELSEPVNKNSLLAIQNKIQNRGRG